MAISIKPQISCWSLYVLADPGGGIPICPWVWGTQGARPGKVLDLQWLGWTDWMVTKGSNRFLQCFIDMGWHPHVSARKFLFFLAWARLKTLGLCNLNRAQCCSEKIAANCFPSRICCAGPVTEPAFIQHCHLGFQDCIVLCCIGHERPRLLYTVAIDIWTHTTQKWRHCQLYHIRQYFVWIFPCMALTQALYMVGTSNILPFRSQK